MPISWTKNYPEVELYDGDQYLVALEVHDNQTGERWWEYSLVKVRVEDDCNESELGISYLEDLNGDCWDWNWEDVEYFCSLDDLKPE